MAVSRLCLVQTPNHLVTLRYVTLHYVTLRYVKYIKLRHITLRNPALRYVTLKYVTCYTTLRYTGLYGPVERVGLAPLVQQGEAVGQAHREAVLSEGGALQVLLEDLLLGCGEVLDVVDGERRQDEVEGGEVGQGGAGQLAGEDLEEDREGQEDERRLDLDEQGEVLVTGGEVASKGVKSSV